MQGNPIFRLFQNKTKRKLYSNSTGNSSLCTELSKHIWHLKDAKIEFNVTCNCAYGREGKQRLL